MITFSGLNHALVAYFLNSKITFKQLEALYWIARLQTFNRAAVRLNASQSTISKRIQELERASGIDVFDRSQHGTRLTVRGEELLAVAEKMLSLHDQIPEIREGVFNRPRILRLGVTELTAMTWLPKLIAEIRLTLPHVKVLPRVDFSRTLLNALELGELDLIIVPDSFTVPELRSVHLENVENVWVAKSGLVDINQFISLQELAQYPMLFQGSNSGSGMLTNKWLYQQGVIFEEAMTCDSITALLGLVVAGMGVSYLPYLCSKSLIEEGKLEMIITSTALPPVPYVAMYSEDRPHSLTEAIAKISVKCSNFTQDYQN